MDMRSRDSSTFDTHPDLECHALTRTQTPKLLTRQQRWDIPGLTSSLCTIISTHDRWQPAATPMLIFLAGPQSDIPTFELPNLPWAASHTKKIAPLRRSPHDTRERSLVASIPTFTHRTIDPPRHDRASSLPPETCCASRAVACPFDI